MDEDINIAKQKVQFGKKQIHILTTEEKDILATYQATKAYATRNKVSLFDEGISGDDLVYPSKIQCQRQIFALLSGSVGVSIILGEEYIVFESEINKAYQIADDLVNKYRLASNTNDVINETKELLKEMITTYKEDILEVKQTLLKDEVVVF